MATFPQANLGAAVELYTGSWTDVTSYVYQRDPIQITRGRPDESAQVNPSQCTLTLNNQDNRFSINNPTGPYYGQLNRNTPLRASVPTALLPAPHNTTYLRMEDDAVSYASTPAASAIELTGSIDVRVDVALSGYGAVLFASIWNASASVNQRSWFFGVGSNGQLEFAFSTDGTLAGVQIRTTDARLPLPIGRLTVRVVYDSTTGNATFYTGPAGGADTGPFTQIGSVSTGSGSSTPMFASTSAPLVVGYNAGLLFDSPGLIGTNGGVFDMELRSGTSTVVAHPAFNAQTAGATTWTDPKGLVWSVAGTAMLSGRSYRFHGELAQTPKAADPSGSDVYSQATASGVLRRLQQSQSPINSPLYRAYVRQSGTGSPVAYWPCEDASAATQLASGLSGGAPLQISGKPQLASNTQVISSAALPVLNGSLWRAQVPQGGTWSINQLQLAAAFPSSPSSETDQEVIASLFTTGTVVRVDLRYGTAGTGSLNIIGVNAAGTQIFSSGALLPFELAQNGGYFLVNFGLSTSGGSVQWQLTIYTPFTAAVATLNGTVTGTLGTVTSVSINTGGVCQQVAVGHIAVQQATAPGIASPFNAWEGETAGFRVQRLCTEEGIACRIVGHPELSIQMGPQTIQTLPDLLQECETTDRGALFEPRTCLGIGYRTQFALYNQAPKASANYALAQVDQGFASTADDLLTLNDITVSNADGSSARQILTSGTMSIQAPPNGIGRVDTAIQVNALSDGYLAGIAQWILHVSTDGHDRFPVLPFNLARTETPMSVATLDIGDLVAVTNPPAWLQPDEIDQVAAGFAETIGPYAVWQIQVNGVPAYPYTIATVAAAASPAATFTGAGYAIHVDTDGTTLTSAVTSTATALSFTTAAGYPAWTVNGGDYPFDVNIAGERVTVVGPGTCLGTDPFLAQGIAKYSGGDSTISLSTAVGAPYPATGYSQSAILVVPIGSPDTFANVKGALSSPGSVAASTSYTLWAWVYATATRTYNLLANWQLNGVSVSTSNTAGVSVIAGTWTLITGTVTSPTSGVNEVVLGVTDNSTPSSAQTFYAWGLNGAAASSISAASPQAMTGQRSVNGVVKAQATAANVTLWYRPVVGQITGA